MKRLLTGIQPTGQLHIGNYFGAMRQAVTLQDSYECFLFVADLHGLNQIFDGATLRQNILEIAKAYLAVGVDPKRVCLYQQSKMPNADLAVILTASTSLGLLERAHAFKDAVAKGKKKINAGLFFYPVLMAADILLYQAEIVPVGEDQRQHLEIAREIAGSFNHVYGQTFVVPQAFIANKVPTIKGLDGQKMSKSYGNTIGLFDTVEDVQKKVSRIVTDSRMPEEPKNLDDTIFLLYQLIASPEQVAEMREAYTKGGMSYKEAKDRLATALNTFMDPMREKKAWLDSNEAYVHDVLADGAKRAGEVAKVTLTDVYSKTGLV